MNKTAKQFLGTYGIGPVTLVVHRYPETVEAIIYCLGEVNTFVVDIAADAENAIALHWAIDLAVERGAMGDVLVLDEGVLAPDHIKAIVTASRTIRYAAATC